jgi:hypothetical protein
MGETRSRHGEMKNLNKILIEKGERQRTSERRPCRWENNIKMHLTKIWFVRERDLSGSGQRAAVGTCKHGNELLCCIKRREAD